MRLLALPVLVLALTTACSSGSDGNDPTVAAPTTQANGARSCGRQQVPSHEGVDVQATGLTCAQAREVILAAVGRGRAAYDSGGLSCTPSDAPDGDTFYACAAGDGRRLTFRYGAA